VFPQAGYSEERYIRQVRERFGTAHFEVRLDDDAVRQNVPGAVAAMDQPTFDGVNTYIVSKLAREAGLTVALSGLGGDELFGGYDTFSLVPRLMRLREMMPAAFARTSAEVVRRATRGADRGEKLARWLRGDDPETSAYALKRELFSPGLRAGLLEAGPITSPAGTPANGHADLINRLSILELSLYMRNVLLRDSDVMSMAHGLEIRVPFLDHRVVELVAGMAGRWKSGSRPPKPLLVDAVRDLLPDEVVTRRKKGFTLPVEHWLRGALRDQVEEVLLDPAHGGQASELLNHGAVLDVWERFCSGKAHWKRPWSLYVLKAWGERNTP
jgi:asparagine synthase (glutamine-hydrolysing)